MQILGLKRSKTFRLISIDIRFGNIFYWDSVFSVFLTIQEKGCQLIWIFLPTTVISRQQSRGTNMKAQDHSIIFEVKIHWDLRFGIICSSGLQKAVLLRLPSC